MTTLDHSCDGIKNEDAAGEIQTAAVFVRNGVAEAVLARDGTLQRRVPPAGSVLDIGAGVIERDAGPDPITDTSETTIRTLVIPPDLVVPGRVFKARLGYSAAGTSTLKLKHLGSAIFTTVETGPSNAALLEVVVILKDATSLVALGRISDDTGVTATTVDVGRLTGQDFSAGLTLTLTAKDGGADMSFYGWSLEVI